MPRRSRVFPCLGFALLIIGWSGASPLFADTVYKKDGRTVEGKIVQETADNIVVETKFGPVTVPRTDVLRVEKGLTTAEEFKQRWESVDRKDVVALLDLADFCSEHQLNTEKKKVYQAIIQVEPDNETARTALGFVLKDGEWLSKADLAKADRDRRAEERKAKKEAAAATDATKSGTSRDALLAGLGDLGAEIAPFLEKMAEHSEPDKKTETELYDFFGQKFTVATTEHFSLRAQMPMEDNQKHLALAERLLATLNKMFGHPAGQRIWEGQYVWFLVKQKGTYIDLVDWIDKYFKELDAEDKKFFKDGGGLHSVSPPISAHYEQSTPLERLIANEVGNTWVNWYSGGKAAEWLQEGFGAYTAVMEFGINQLWHSTNTKYAGRTEIADKDSDAHLRLVCLDICDGVTEKAYPFTDLWKKKLNDLDYADLAKSYSMVDFLITEHRDNFRKFLQSLRSQPDEELALKAAFGWTAEELDTHWKEYVLKNYDRTPSGN